MCTCALPRTGLSRPREVWQHEAMTTHDDAKWARRAPLKSRDGDDAIAHDQNRPAQQALEPEELRTSLEVERFFDLFENRS